MHIYTTKVEKTVEIYASFCHPYIYKNKYIWYNVLCKSFGKVTKTNGVLINVQFYEIQKGLYSC